MIVASSHATASSSEAKPALCALTLTYVASIAVDVLVP